MQLELCATSLAETRAAKQAKLHRVELCMALELGGLTPSWSLIRQAVLLDGPEVHVMLRPRAGGFEYTEAEIDLMLDDLNQCKTLGAHGVVFGCTHGIGALHIQHNQLLVDQAKQQGMACTFHRAFDLLDNMELGLDQLIELGFDRVLTSGGQPMAIQGLSTIRSLVERAQGQIEIMAGSGVKGANAALFQGAGVDAVHFSARRKMEEPISLGMGERFEPDEEKIRQVKEAIKDNVL